ncbi:hypothetical protein Agub_g3279 [Astrephomene gubernaculifera]|uniref:Uncharacterized protein n=1 Tax=Astrephomene gubernaculifera TaxID=47775 RepID=A0AAD3DJ51_9CHLO|nr:hypothetical protein Agub_g3279 [Astrephomene gubernaculifera]
MGSDEVTKRLRNYLCDWGLYHKEASHNFRRGMLQYAAAWTAPATSPPLLVLPLRLLVWWSRARAATRWRRVAGGAVAGLREWAVASCARGVSAVLRWHAGTSPGGCVGCAVFAGFSWQCGPGGGHPCRAAA